MHRYRRFLVFLTAALSVAARADLLVEETFDDPARWRKATSGGGSVEIVDSGITGPCVKLVCDEQGTARFEIRLDAETVRGRTLHIRGMVKTVDVIVGQRIYNTAKFHVGGRVGGRPFNNALWFSGTQDWHEESYTVSVPEDIEAPFFDLALQQSAGTVYFDNIVIDDGRRPRMAVDLSLLANTSLSDGVAGDGRGGFLDTGQVDLRDVPRGDVLLGGVHFRIPEPGENAGATCLILEGKERPDLPEAPVRPGRKGKKPQPAWAPVEETGVRLLFLHAASRIDAECTAPCLVYRVRYADGEIAEIPIREGTDIGAYDDPVSLPNWTVVWTGSRAGKTVGVGMSEWPNPRPDVPVDAVTARSTGTGAVPVILAITLDRVGE